MTDYRKIWKSINEESANNPDKVQIARKVSSSGTFSAFLATDFRRKIRLLYIGLEKNHYIETGGLPELRGLEVSRVISSIGKFKNTDFLKFSQSIPETENIFESVIADICNEVLQIQNREELIHTLTKVLGEWKFFFDNSAHKLLTLPEQTGLIGELLFLKNYLFRKYSHEQALLFWTGASRTNHDFQLGDKAFEIKTTTSKKHRKFTVSSEKQLDNTGLRHLYLILFTLNTHDNRTSDTLSSLINAISDMLHDDSVALFQFEIRLAKYGYNILHSGKYTTGFSVAEINCFEVKTGFPRLIHTHLPDGIGDVKYTVMVSICTPYKISENIIDLI